MKVVSLFDGISCAYVALQKAGVPITSYIAYEIDPYAIKVSKSNFPMIVQKGNVKDLKDKIDCDLLIGGSPCIDLSVAKQHRKGLAGDYSSLFWEYVRIKNLLAPKWFVLENVASMKDCDKDTISKALGVEPILFDARLVSAQNRKRYFWTNIPFALPDDKHITFSQILQQKVDDKYFISKTANLTTNEPFLLVSVIGRRLDKDGKRCDADEAIEYQQRVAPKKDQTKCGTLTGVSKDNMLYIHKRIRRLTPIECERLMGLADDYTASICETKRYKVIGNAFNCDVVAHILKGLLGK